MSPLEIVAFACLTVGGWVSFGGWMLAARRLRAARSNAHRLAIRLDQLRQARTTCANLRDIAVEWRTAGDDQVLALNTEEWLTDEHRTELDDRFASVLETGGAL